MPTKVKNPVAAIAAEAKKTAAAAKVIWKILEKDFFPADLEMVNLYTASDWCKGPQQQVGRGACLTFTAEGQVYMEMNYGHLQAKIDRALAPLGLYTEQGHGWSWHIYPSEVNNG